MGVDPTAQQRVSDDPRASFDGGPGSANINGVHSDDSDARDSAAAPTSSTPGGSDSEAQSNSGEKNATQCAQPSPGSAPLRRLSNVEYRNSVQDLFSQIDGIDELVSQATREFPAESESLGFRNSAEFLTVQPLLAQKYMDAAEQIAAQAARSSEIASCTPKEGAEMDCARTFIAEFGKRVYRRALAANEVDRYERVFQTALDDYDFATGVEWVIFTLLQSPQFLYRVEAGSPSASAAVTRPTAQEMATRLAYFFWQSTPDQALLDAAEQNGLDSPEEVEQLAREMLRDSRSGRLFQYFIEWLDLDRLQEFNRDPAVFPGLPDELPNWLQEESRSLVSSLLARPDGNFTELLTAPYTYANSGLAAHYGLPDPGGDSFVRIDAPGRSGILTQALVLSHDKPYRTSIVRRGLKIRTDFLCQNVPAPPNDVPLDLDSSAASATQRERLEQHRTDPSCAGCHELLDPLGIVFETFDAVGRYRTVDEAGEPIVTDSTLAGTLDADGPIANAQQLGQRLAQSQQARDCYVTQTFRFFFGREVEAADACSIARMQQAFAASEQSLSELLVAVTQTDAFLFRPKISEVSP